MHKERARALKYSLRNVAFFLLNVYLQDFKFRNFRDY